MAVLSIEQLFDQAIAHHDAGRLPQAEPLYRQILMRDPNHADALHGLGMLAYASGHRDDGLKLVRRAIQLNPGAWLYQGNLALILAGMGRTDEAMAAYRQAIVMSPNSARLHSNLGAALLERYQLEEALSEFRQAVALEPGFGEAYSNMGNVLRELGRISEAAAALRQAAAIVRTEPKVVWNLAFALLLGGEFREGWQAFEARWHIPEIAMHRELVGPLWDGTPLPGRTILLHDEQGFGDTIQFVRYAPMVRATGANVVICCQPLLRRFLMAQPALGQVMAGDTTPQYQAHCPLMSLPRLMGTNSVESIPAARSYFVADPALAGQWRARLAALPGRLKIGLTWAGNPQHSRDRVRTIKLEQLAPLAGVQDVTFISLQKSETTSKVPPAGMNLVDWTQDLNDFADTAALVSELDLIVAVDTAVVHLGGALGKPVWMLTPFSPDWRWLMGRADSPWYPTVRLFRQPMLGDWRSPIQQIAGELRAMASTGHPGHGFA